jgi:hypothetical protein
MRSTRPINLWCVLLMVAALFAMPAASFAGDPPQASSAIQTPIAYWVPFEVTAPNGTKVKLVLVPSQYADRAAVMTSDFQVWHLVKTDGVQPGPSPTPTPPTPPVPPTPTPKKAALLYLILETGDLTPQVAAVKDAKAWRDAADAAGVRWTVADDETGAKVWPNVVKKAREATLPCVVFVDPGGVPTTEPLPATVDAMTALVKKYGGGN